MNKLNKGNLMKLAYTKEELGNVDSAIPCELWNEVDTSIHVMDYNEPHRMGKLVNLEEKLKEKGVII